MCMIGWKITLFKKQISFNSELHVLFSWSNIVQEFSQQNASLAFQPYYAISNDYMYILAIDKRICINLLLILKNLYFTKGL